MNLCFIFASINTATALIILNLILWMRVFWEKELIVGYAFWLLQVIFKVTLLPVYFLNRCGVQLLARNQPHYCHVENCNCYLHNSCGPIISIPQYAASLTAPSVCRLEMSVLYQSKDRILSSPKSMVIILQCNSNESSPAGLLGDLIMR